MVKVFAHRGFVQNNIKQNSIASLKNAVKNNFTAIEFDIWFFDGEFYLSHDKPTQLSLNNLPRFRDYLLFENRLDYWIDFKNLNEQNIVDALELINRDIKKSKINLEKVYFAPYITDYDLAEKISHYFYKTFGSNVNTAIICDNVSLINKAIELIDIGVFKYISIDYKLINDDVLTKVSSKKLLAWTVNDRNIFNDLVLKGVDKFASDSLEQFPN